MTVDTEKVIQLMEQRIGKVTYSMGGARDILSNTCDCSGAVCSAIVRCGGEKGKGYIQWTGNMPEFLSLNGYELVYAGTPNSKPFECKRGDVFIWSPNGADGNLQVASLQDARASAGSAGHTGIFVDETKIIHCNYGYNGISINDYNTILQVNQPYYDGGIAELIFRKTGNATEQTPPITIVKPQVPTQQTNGNAGKQSGLKVYRVDDMMFYGGIWQAITYDLAPKNARDTISFEQNGIPFDCINEVDRTGVYTSDNTIEGVGKYFVFDTSMISDTGQGGVDSFGEYYWRSFHTKNNGNIWLSAYTLNDLLYGKR
ncbi:Target recognition domain of lytic exoenzyme [Pilibacter termitis]|uniref:Target recognition domain of lytic exoenzyme n=1 Tax=Pilibacter termitis TaxID=263852 RepID=A0A1T4PFH0_9ENTE|nr:peptidoglycan amidohydrolase family protein [Pilibacter termitis]SJZ90077.1 Target recognition domain of lytic exoenzyme [Pilibacter termitis]